MASDNLRDKAVLIIFFARNCLVRTADGERVHAVCRRALDIGATCSISAFLYSGTSWHRKHRGWSPGGTGPCPVERGGFASMSRSPMDREAFEDCITYGYGDDRGWPDTPCLKPWARAPLSVRANRRYHPNSIRGGSRVIL